MADIPKNVVVVVGGFRGEDGADVALPAVKRQAELAKLKIYDAGLVRRLKRKEVQINDTGDWGFGKGFAAAGAAGGVVAALAGPIGWGLMAGAAVVGGIVSAVRDTGINDNAMRALGKAMEDRTSALILMVAPEDAATATKMLEDAGANVTSQGMDADTVTKLAHAYNGIPQAAATTAADATPADAATEAPAQPEQPATDEAKS